MRALPLIVLALLPLLATAGPLAFASQEVPVTVTVRTREYPVLAGGDAASATWRTVLGSGNCCESYLAATPDGSLVDVGGRLKISHDAGASWFAVTSTLGIVNGEGAVVGAPNGDTLAMVWDPYSGDRVIAYKRDAATGRWSHEENQLHAPFYDRPWLAVANGPFEIAGETHAYAAIMRGGWPYKEPYVLSLDGLRYALPSSRGVESAVPPPVLRWIDQPADPSSDYTQAHHESGFTTLPDGHAIAQRVDISPSGCGWSIMRDTTRWSCWYPPTAVPLPLGVARVDSTGTIWHVARIVDGFRVSTSTDGARTWTPRDLALPAGHSVEDVDFKAHGAAGVAALAVHAHDSATGKDRDLLYKITDAGVVLHQVGLGDREFGSGLGSSLARFDFTSVAILPDGRVAVAFGDSEHDPGVAIEM